MTKHPWPHIDPAQWETRLAELEALIPLRGPGSELDLLKAEASWLSKQIENRISNETAIIAPNSPAWVGQQPPLR